MATWKQANFIYSKPSWTASYFHWKHESLPCLLYTCLFWKVNQWGNMAYNSKKYKWKENLLLMNSSWAVAQTSNHTRADQRIVMKGHVEHFLISNNNKIFDHNLKEIMLYIIPSDSCILTMLSPTFLSCISDGSVSPGRDSCSIFMNQWGFSAMSTNWWWTMTAIQGEYHQKPQHTAQSPGRYVLLIAVYRHQVNYPKCVCVWGVCFAVLSVFFSVPDT